MPSEKDTREPDPRKKGNQAKESNRVQGSCTVHHSEVIHMLKLSGNCLLLTASQDRDVYVYYCMDNDGQIWDQQLAQNFLLKADAMITSVTTTVILFHFK